MAYKGVRIAINVTPVGNNGLILYTFSREKINGFHYELRFFRFK